MKSTCRAAALLLALLFTALMLGAAAFTALHTDHDCTGDGCLVCEELSICEALLTAGGVVIAAAAAVHCFIRAARALRIAVRNAARSFTLISLKVMLLD
ncbi:MAG: hypothetical protein IJ561_04235 [Ruminococcus sp.]|nr:hypothetical protein [Ruminococcus sp.]